MEITTVKQAISPFPVHHLQLLLVGTILLFTGCNRMAWPPNPPQRSLPMVTLTSAPSSPDIYPKHNFTTVSAGAWTLELWTLGSSFEPWNGVDIGLKLATNDSKAAPPPETIAQVDLLDAKTGELVIHRTITPMFAQDREKSPGAWQASLIDVFQSDGRKKGFQQLKVGKYLISITLMIGQKTELKTNNIPIEVDVSVGH
jgi:hypothetical protein